MSKHTYHIELLTPKQNSTTLDEDLDAFGHKYRQVLESGYIASITDNPMGHLHFQATDVVAELGLPVKPEQLLIHLNTFHTKEDLDSLLTRATEIKARYLLAVTGDGGERLPKLSPAALGFTGPAVTSVELLQYIAREYPGHFVCGVAFNPYEPLDHEMEKMRRKLDAGAAFIITQPVIGKHDAVDQLHPFHVPVIVGAWMSKNIQLLSGCVGYAMPENRPYDPIANLKALRHQYPAFGLYLALLGFKTQFPLLRELL